MYKEIINILLPVIAGLISAIGASLITILIKSKSDKRKMVAEADVSEIEVEKERIDFSKIKDQYVRESVESAYKQLDEMGEKLRDFRNKLLKLEDDLYNATQKGLRCERKSEHYKSLLIKLINFVSNNCPGIDIEEYKREILNNEE